MSYSNELKGSIVTLDIKSRCCAAAELCALYMINEAKIFKMDNEDLIRRISALASKASEYFSAGEIQSMTNKSNKTYYSIKVDELAPYDKNGVNERFCCSDGFLRGCFLYSGYIASPDKPARAEIAFKNTDAFEICKCLLEQSGIKYNITKRGNRDVIYIKSMSGVSDFLARIGAVGAMLQFENNLIIKNCKNDANRAANCDNANLDKAVSAAMRQVAIISEFMKSATFESLSPELREIAALRVENVSLSLKELGGMLTPMLSKSGVAHRLKKLEEIAVKSLNL